MAIMKAYVIQLTGIESSEILARECIASGANLNLPIEIFNGIYGEEQIEKYHNVFEIRPWKPKMKKHRIGVKGCFLSHYSLWTKCYKEQIPLIIFEHDAFVLRPLPNKIMNKFDEFLMLDPYNKMKKTYEKLHANDSHVGIEEYFNDDVSSKYGVTSQYVMGLQAYIIKPKAAEKLINYVKQNGYLPADIQCNKSIINIQTVYPSIASINPKFYNNKKLMKEESSTHKQW